MDFNNFKQWEKASRETIDFKTIYVDIANGDIISGLLLSQIIFWFLPDKNGRSKLRAYKDGKYWLAKQRTDWYGEIRVSPKQYDRAIKILEDLGLVVVDNSLFDGKKTPFIWLNGEILAQKVNEILLQRAESSAVLPKGKNRFSPKGKIGFDERSIPITENTTENTTEIDNILSFEEIEPQKDVIPYQEIVDYLNLKAGTSYRHSTSSTQKLIRARWNEGFRLDDFKQVSDNMTAKWKGDPKMEQYLRPQTLFGTKFESYLQITSKTKPKEDDPYDEDDWGFKKV